MLSITVNFCITEYRSYLTKVAHKNICSEWPASSIDITLRVTGQNMIDYLTQISSKWSRIELCMEGDKSQYI
jgi:hypothetical protein